MTIYGKIHHFVAGKIHYVYGPCLIANCKRWPLWNTSSTRPETRWQWHHSDVLGTFSPSGGPVAPCPAGGWDTIGYPLEPPPPTPVLRDSAERTCSTSSVLVAFECPTGQPYPDGPGKLRKHMNKCYISGEVVEKCQHSRIFNVSILIIWRVYDGLWESGVPQWKGSVPKEDLMSNSYCNQPLKHNIPSDKQTYLWKITSF